MAKIGCPCGGVVRDQLFPNPIKARFVQDQDFDNRSGPIAQALAGYMEAVRKGEAKAFLASIGFQPEYLRLDLPHASVIDDIIREFEIPTEREMFECETCGGLLVEGTPGYFRYYTPEDGKPVGIFSTNAAQAPD